MKISVIHPSRGRHQQAYRTAKNWISKADNRFDYFLSFDSDEQDVYCRQFELYQDVIVGLNGPNKSAIEAINKAALLVTTDLFVVISDDFDCPEHWDTLLLNELEGKSDFVLKTDDEYQPTLVSLPIMDRIFYERYGYIYHPDYLHMFCDQEMTAVALMTGKYLKSALKFPHHHYTTGKTEKDEINVKNDMTWKQGQRLFDRHLENNFGIENPVMAYTDIKWK